MTLLSIPVGFAIRQQTYEHKLQLYIRYTAAGYIIIT